MPYQEGFSKEKKYEGLIGSLKISSRQLSLNLSFFFFLFLPYRPFFYLNKKTKTKGTLVPNLVSFCVQPYLSFFFSSMAHFFFFSPHLGLGPLLHFTFPLLHRNKTGMMGHRMCAYLCLVHPSSFPFASCIRLLQLQSFFSLSFFFLFVLSLSLNCVLPAAFIFYTEVGCPRSHFCLHLCVSPFSCSLFVFIFLFFPPVVAFLSFS